MTASTPTNHDNKGRDNKGRFTAGNKAAQGNPYSRKAAAYRAAGYKPKTPEVATVCAIALLAKPNIQARIKHLNDEALEIEQLHAPFTAMPAGRADR